MGYAIYQFTNIVIIIIIIIIIIIVITIILLIIIIIIIIANTKKYLQSNWVRGVQYWYLYSVFNICTLLNNKKNQHSISVAEK